MHQDGVGTVDAGHTDLFGYNEVIMFRRLNHRQQMRVDKELHEACGWEGPVWDGANGFASDDGNVKRPGRVTRQAINRLKEIG